NLSKPVLTHRLNVKTHVFKKELQEYVPTQIEDRLRIETIIYVELSIVDQNNSLVNIYDYARLPKDLFFSQPDKVMSPEEMSTKRIIDIVATLQCPSNNWQEEKEACLRCARRMSTKLDQTESRIMHMLPELHRTETGDALISFRSGVANIQFKINCYCGHKKEKEGFVIRFDSRSDATIASHVTLPLMLYHQNKNRVASRAIAAAAKAQAKSDQQQPEQSSNTRNIVKSVTSKTKRVSRSKPGHSPIGNHQHIIPSPPNSLIDSPVEWTSSPEMDDIMDISDTPFTVPSPPPPDPLISLFPESSSQEQQQQQQPTIALISHMTPNSGTVRGGTLVTIHGTGFTVGEVMYVCFGENLVPIIPQRDHMLECITPASNKAETVPVFAMNTIESNVAQATFTYVDDNEKELIKLALQRMLNISARMEGPVDNVLSRANEFALWNDLLQGDDSSISSLNGSSYANLEDMVVKSLQILDTQSSKNIEGVSIVNNTGHTMLHLAVALQYESLVKDLLVRSVDMGVQDKNGLTALDWARRMNSQTMVNLLSGSPVASAFIVDGKDYFTAECGEVARGLELSVSPGSRPTATDQPGLDDRHGGIAGITQLSQPAAKDSTLDLTDQVNPQLAVPWDGFGQGPGNDVAMDDGVVHGLFQTQHEDDFFVQQARKDSPRLTGEVVDQDKRFAIQQHQIQQDQYQKILSAIPTSSDRMMAFVPAQDDYSPTPLVRLPIEGVDKVGQAGAIVQSHHNNIPIDFATSTSPIVDLNPVRQLVGGLEQSAPVDQDLVTTEGCTLGAAKDNSAQVGVPMTVQLEGIPGSGCTQGLSGSGITQSIQSTAKIDMAPLDVREPTADVVVVGNVVDAQDQDPRQLHLIEENFETAMFENPVRMPQEGEVVVDTDNSEDGSHNSVAVQAVVQNSRNDESEQVLFLGGLPVSMSPRSARTAPLASVSIAAIAVTDEKEDQSSSNNGDATQRGASPSTRFEDEA
ncbi:SPT3 Dosage dependent suppressor of Ty-induced promoter mutations-like protein, partial [Entomortierella lignicola]